MENEYISKEDLEEAELILDLSRWTAEGAPTMDVAFTHDRLDDAEKVMLDAWLGNSVERNMQWDRMRQQAREFTESLRPRTMEALTRFGEALNGCSKSVGNEIRTVRVTAELPESGALCSLFGFADAKLPSVVVTPGFRSNPVPYDGQPEAALEDGELAIYKGQSGYRWSVAQGDLNAAQALQQLCATRGVAIPWINLDTAERFAFEQPVLTGHDRPAESKSEYECTNVFVVGLASNETFVRLYNSRLASAFTLDMKQGMKVRLPQNLDGLRSMAIKKCQTHNVDGSRVEIEGLGPDDMALFNNFVLFARIREPRYTYFILGGDSEGLTHIAGQYLASFWASLWRCISCAGPDDDFVKIFRVGSLGEHRRPTLTPFLSVVGNLPELPIGRDKEVRKCLPEPELAKPGD